MVQILERVFSRINTHLERIEVVLQGRKKEIILAGDVMKCTENKVRLTPADRFVLDTDWGCSLIDFEQKIGDPQRQMQRLYVKKPIASR